MYTVTYMEYEELMELLLHCSVLHLNGPALPPGTLLPMKPWSPSPLRSPPCNRGVQIGPHVKEERL